MYLFTGVVLDRLSSALSHIDVVVQRLLTLLFKSVPVAIVSEEFDDVLHSEVCEVSLAKKCLDDLFGLSKESPTSSSNF